ncbi:MAG: DUF4230 domain-containing protein [Dysgonamonadaceae bacterium]|jgi:hypothetical protein|nr:DUF4230 domain-containing protein [Dysgonamonadaceae bacterium]
MKTILKLLLGIAIGIIICLFFFLKTNNKGTQTVTSHQATLEKVEALGKLELVRMNIKDVMEHKLIRQWLPNASALLIISGEAVGCIDLQKVEAEDIVIQKDTLRIKLPAPELCYFKIDHKNSKVYETKFNYFTGINLVEEAFKEAEKQLWETALESGILDRTKENTIIILKPFFEGLGFKQVEISFP